MKFTSEELEDLFDKVDEKPITKQNAESYTDDELNILLSKYTGKEFRILKNEFNSRKENARLEEFRRLNPGVPDHAIELIIGNDYEGYAEGEFTVKSINGKLWFISGECCDFYKV